MAIQSVDQLKQWFETGDKPTQQQFWDWLDSYVHKSEGFAISDISGLLEALQAKADVAALSNLAGISSRMIYADNVGGLPATSNQNAAFVLVNNVGIVRAVESAEIPNWSTSYPSADAGWVWELVLQPGGSGAGMLADRFVADANYVYTLDEGFSIDKIKIKPDGTETVRVGLSNGGEEIMFDETLTAGVWKTITIDVDAAGADVNIYFNGMTGNTSVTVYKRAL